MEMIQQNARPDAEVPARDIPTPPGGGSWTFNETTWKWESNDVPLVDDNADQEEQ